MSRKKVILVGPLPPPYGGVSEFILRLSKRSFIDSVYDIYPKKKERKIRKLFNIIKLAYKVRISSKTIFHFNFSRVNFLFLFLFLFLLKGRDQVWLLTLHHGYLENLSNRLPYNKQIFFFILNRFNRVIALSDLQYDFYKKNKIGNIVRLTSYLPINNDIRDKHILKLKNNEITILISGYPNKLYNYDYLLDYSISNKGDKNIKYIFCVYGHGDWGYIDDLESRGYKNNINCCFYRNLDRESFYSILEKSNIYTRPTSIDSYGIVVADAVILGLDVIASNVCERFPGCSIYHANNKEEFNQLLDKAIDRAPKFKTSNDYEKIGLEYIDSYRKLYNSF